MFIEEFFTVFAIIFSANKAFQLFLTSIPLIGFDTNNTIILFDEPERSLYPDLQREIVAYYTGLAPTAQFFFATHSPIIAAEFEPCERFILGFDDEGYVTTESTRRGGEPEGAFYNRVLRADFDITSTLGQKGQIAWERYQELKSLIRAENDAENREKLLDEQEKLGDLYNFPA